MLNGIGNNSCYIAQASVCDSFALTYRPLINDIDTVCISDGPTVFLNIHRYPPDFLVLHTCASFLYSFLQHLYKQQNLVLLSESEAEPSSPV